jgi:L-ascorbate metabolism protein UlaG (beta-lactamase superfamily)
MKKPVLQDGAFLADVARARSQRDRLHIWWLGQSGFLVLYQDDFLLLDPYLSDSLTKKYAGTNKPHIRMTERVIAPAKLDFVAIVTSSHIHTDHLDAETIRPLLTTNPNLTILVSTANCHFAAERLQLPPKRLTTIACDQPQTLGPWTFHAVPAAHEELALDENGDHKFIGLVVEVGSWTLYHSGDTLRYAGMVNWLKPFSIDVAMLPINGRDPARGVAGNLSGPEAVQLAQDCHMKQIIPCHFDMFEFNTVAPDAFVTAAAQAGQAYHLLQNGERWSLLPGEGTQ